MIKVSHEFPLKYYLNGFASRYTDYDYILAHRYLSDEDYKNYALSQRKVRPTFLDNSLYELREALTGDLYASIIEELKPNYYFLPDVFDSYIENIENQVSFYRNYSYRFNQARPVAICHGKTPEDILNSFKEMDSILPDLEHAPIYFAIPMGSSAWSIDEGNPFTSNMIPNESLRRALNRKMFIKNNCETLSRRKIHLLGCKSLKELDCWGNDFDKSFIVSIDTSLPVTMSFEGKSLEGNEHYKPDYLIDKHFSDTEFDETNLINNIEYFRRCLRKWEG